MNVAQYTLLLGIRVYRWILSPAKTAFLGPSGRCRFTPSCSEYAVEAIRTHGASQGAWLAARRFCRCHPWGDCGHDPVPAAGPANPDGKFHVTLSSDSGPREDAVQPCFECDR